MMQVLGQERKEIMHLQMNLMIQQVKKQLTWKNRKLKKDKRYYRIGTTCIIVYARNFISINFV